MILVIDMQNDFSGDTLWAVPGIYDIVTPIRALVEAFPDEVLFTRWVNPMKGRFLEYPLCLPDSFGVDILPALLPLVKPNTVFDKVTYTCFSNQDLVDRLRNSGSKELYLTGVETDCCVLATALSAMDELYDVYMVKDCLASSRLPCHDYGLEIVERLRPGSVITSQDLLSKQASRL